MNVSWIINNYPAYYSIEKKTAQGEEDIGVVVA